MEGGEGIPEQRSARRRNRVRSRRPRSALSLQPWNSEWRWRARLAGEDARASGAGLVPTWRRRLLMLRMPLRTLHLAQSTGTISALLNFRFQLKLRLELELRGGTHVSSQHLCRKRVFLMSAKAVIIPQRESRHAEHSLADFESRGVGS
jgi:hypothetical protein